MLGSLAMSTPRRILVLAAFAAIVATRMEPRLLRLPFIDRGPLAAGYARQADGDWAEYVVFLNEVRARTRDGDTIAIIVPRMRWDQGYSYAYYRASYFLAGRVVLPVDDERDQLHFENVRAAKYVAAWRNGAPNGRYHMVWAGNHGVLLEH